MINKITESFVSVVIYIHNQQENIQKFVDGIYQVLNESFKNFEIICVDDGSTDNSVSIIKELALNYDNTVLSIIHMGKTNGKELAMKAGIDASIGDYVFEFEMPDDELNMKLITDAFNKSVKGYDIVNCVNKNNKRYVSKLFYYVFNHFSNINNSIHTVTFRLVSRRAINRTESMSTSFFFRKALYANCGLQEYNLYYDGNKSKTQGTVFSEERVSTAIDAMLLFTKIGYKISIGLTIFMSVFSMLVLIYTITVYSMGQTIAGWTPIMLFMSFSFLGLFIVITIIIKYMDLLINLNFKKRDYIIESMEKITK